MYELTSLALAVSALLLASPAFAQAEQPGPYQTDVWKSPPGAPVPVTAGVFFPTNAPCPGALVALVHGYGEIGEYKVRMAELMASRGLVAVAPSLAGALTNPSQADADALNQLLDWLAQQSQSPGTPISGKIDAAAPYGIAGHSNGGIVFLAASQNPKIQAAIGWDAVAGLNSTPGLHGPSLHLFEQGSYCGGGSKQGYNGAPAPKAGGTITNGSHCDFDDPVGPFCVGVCGTPPWSQPAAAVIEHYSVAFFTCVLGHDPSMAQYLDFNAGSPGLSGATQEGAFNCLPACASGGSGAGGASGAAGDGGVGAGGAGGSGAQSGSGGSSGAGVGGSGIGGACSPPGCECSGCYDYCVCTTGNASACVSACGTSTGGASGAAGKSAASSGSDDSGGCGCRTAGTTAPAPLAFGFAFLAGLLARRRARREAR